ncbi:MAG TPA: TonB-dependent receptor [Nitrospiria bacterium]|nr:TonB-dependent receptor [Candidatus Manganitrophaceae bacterium]
MDTGCVNYFDDILRTTGGVRMAFPAEGTDDLETKILDKILVIGNPSEAEGMPGSAHVVVKEEIRKQAYDDINRVLRKVPGVYVREEDGFGLFPNISLRGVDTSRSAKVTIMEDGILMAPAPYSAPSAYYSPTVGRMSGLEVLKGSSQIKYGPHITGGVINYLSTPIPNKKTVYLKSMYGSFNELRTHAYVGNTIDTKVGRFGFLLEGYTRKNDGFKRIDRTPDFRDSDDTGFTKTEPMIKVSWEPKTAIYQHLELKYGQTKLDANETYLGLSEADFNANPTRRYAASRFDNMDAMQKRTSLRYAVSPTDDLDIITTLYYNTFDRNWYKLNDLRALPVLPVSVNMSLSEALAGGGGGEGLACLKGAGVCTLRVRANNRSYKAKGAETVTYYRFGSEVWHEVSFGIRYHMDEVRRFQWNDLYAQSANGTISGLTPGTPGDAGDRLQETDALAFYLQDTIEAGPWTFIPGIRYERLDQTSEDPKGTLQGAGGTKGRDGENSLDMVGGGLGVSYRVNEAWTTFGGVHRGFSPPSPRGTRSGLDEETSLAFETGARYRNRRQALAVEAVLFYTQFKDLVVTDNVGGTGSGDDENFGEVDSYGLEFSSQIDPGIANRWKVRNPWYLTLTYTNAEQQNDARSTDAESIFSFGKKGNKVTYVPEWVISVGTGVETERWGGFISGTYVDETFSSADNSSLQVNGDGDPDARFGKTDSYFVADLTGFYRISEEVKLFGGVQNLFDEEYIVSRQPHGPRPGMPLFGYVGIELSM